MNSCLIRAILLKLFDAEFLARRFRGGKKINKVRFPEALYGLADYPNILEILTKSSGLNVIDVKITLLSIFLRPENLLIDKIVSSSN